MKKDNFDINRYSVIVIVFTFIFNLMIIAQPKVSSISSAPGAFSRMGFGARGMAMGNSISAVNEGNITSYYNPALVVFQNSNYFSITYSFLSLDRNLNTLNYVRNFNFYKKDSSGNRTEEIQSTSGISVGIINSGVRNIDGRNSSGFKTEIYSTSENQFFLTLGLKPSKFFSLGISAKLYYYSLFEKISTTSLGFDIGALFQITDNLNLSLVLIDLNSKYKWDSTPLWEQEGKSNLEEEFPTIKKIGVAYKLPDKFGIASMEYESTNLGTNNLKFGTEINLTEFFVLRLGLDRLNLSNSDMIPKYSFGFLLQQILYGVNFNLEYAFVREPYSPFDQHILTLGTNF